MIFTDINQLQPVTRHARSPHALGHMPFAITLMAKLAKKSRSAPDELLEMWREGGTDLQEPWITPLLVREQQTCVDNPEALTLLATLSMLPRAQNMVI